MYFSINWERDKCNIRNVVKVRVTVLDEQGNCQQFVKYYDEWIGVCTNDIDKVVDAIKRYFPGSKVLYREIGRAKKVLPYFEDRLARNKLDYKSKPFYKIYTNASHKNIGRFFNRYKIGYFDPDEWLVRIYIDLCTKYDTQSFYYKWYEILQDSSSSSSSNRLLDSFRMIPDRRDVPDWTVAAFDIESVPLVGNHVPMGYYETDRIVMMSLFKWNERQGISKWLLYVLPEGITEPLETTSSEAEKISEEAFETESDMLIRFHKLLYDVQVVTGYNINSFDFPCIFARCLWLGLSSVIRKYTSMKMGLDSVVTYDDKIVLDLYTYFKTFSGYDLPSFKLDDVAQVKLSGETKLQVKSTGIWSWYRQKDLLPSEIFTEQHDVEKCYEFLKPETVSRSSEFGTFRTYLDYCLRDSELVYRLFVKEYVLSFLMERANFTALSAVQVLHLGNSRYLLELFKTYGMRLGYFVNPRFFDASSSSSDKYETIFPGKTYQGALNFCHPQTVYKDVVVMDFASMYPSSLLNSNLCYGTCTIMNREEWLSKNIAGYSRLKSIPYRQHSDADFLTNTIVSTTNFSYPVFDPKEDEYAIVVDSQSEAFLPQIVSHFIEMRQHHQREWKATRDVYHYNVQLGIKILINSLYGVMANKDSVLAYLPIAMTIVTLSRYQLLGSYHYLKNEGYEVCYADTDSLMVHKWPHENCDRVNAFLNLPHVELKYEQRMKLLIILSKKRYVYERSEDDAIVTKGFQKKINGLVKFMTEKILTSVWQAVVVAKEEETTPSRGWIVWAETISEANYMCRDPKKYSIYRKIKNLCEYKSLSCPSVKYLKKYPDKNQEHVEFTYSRADVAKSEASNWVMDVEDCQWVNYEKLFISQKKIFCMLLDLAFWKSSPDSFKQANMVLNAMHWKKFVLAELLHYHATGGKRLALLVEPGIQYTFTINDHLKKSETRRRLEEEDEERENYRLGFELLNLWSAPVDMFDDLDLDEFESKLFVETDEEEEQQQSGKYGKRKKKKELDQNKKMKFLEEEDEIFSDDDYFY